MKKKRLFVYSVDALVQEDITYLKSQKNFAAYLDGSSGPLSLRTIYPSVTYPVHASLQTGCYPDKTGVFANNVFNVEGSTVEWLWHYSHIKTDTIFSAAKRGGYSTAAAFWPVTACNPDIDFHLPEYWLAHKGETLRGAFMDLGASDYVADIMERHAACLSPDYLEGKSKFTLEPNFDDFMIHVVCDLLRERKPEVTLIHGSIIDSFRHKYGIFGPKITEGLSLVDKWFGFMVQAMKDAGTYEDTNIVVLSDHGQQDVVRVVRPNVYLADAGFITLDASSKVVDYSAYGMSNGMSMTFYLKDPDDKKTFDVLHRFLDRLVDDGVFGFSEVFTRQEAAERFHLDGDFALIAESDGYTSFSDKCARPIASRYDLLDWRMGHATHGYLPDKGPQPVFFAKGPDITPDVRLPRRPIVDVAPTFAALLGVRLKDAQGTAMKELLRTDNV